MLKVKDVKTVRIDYKDGSFLGIGGDKSCTYRLCIYRCPKMNDVEINVFIADYMPAKEQMTIDDNAQYGIDNGTIFFVFHGEQKKHGIYQWRFTKEAGGLTLTKNAAVASN